MSRRHRLCKLLFVAIALLSLYSGAAHAAGNDKDAAHLKALFTDILDQQGKETTLHGGTMVRDGDILVEPSDNYYAVTLPYLTFKAADQSRLEIGMVAINVVPGDSKQEWKMTVAIPTPITWYDPAGKPQIIINAGRQNFAGIWNEKLNNFTKLQAQYSDISVTAADKSFTAKIPAFSSVYDFKQDRNGHLSGPASFEALGFEIAFNDGRFAHIDKASLSAALNDYDMGAAASYKDKIEALAPSLIPGTADVNPVANKALFDLMTAFIGNVWDGFDSGVELQGIIMARPADDPKDPAQTLKINHIALGSGISGFRKGSAAATLRLAYDGFTVTPPLPALDEAAPSHAAASLTVSNLPYKDLMKAVSDAMGAPGTKPDFLSLLTAAGTVLDLKDTAIGNTSYNVGAKGEFMTDKQAALHYTGTAHIDATGLDNLSHALSERMKNPVLTPAQRVQLQQMVASLMIMQLSGQPGTDAAGKAVKIYDLAVTKDGSITMNGVPVGMMSGAVKKEKKP